MSEAQRSCLILLLSLVLLLVLFPFLEAMARPILLITVIAGVLLGGVVAVEAGRRHVRNALLLTLVQIILAVSASLLDEGSLGFLVAVSVGLAAMAALIVYAIYCVLRYVLQARVITREQIYAGISVYLLLGFAFGAVYYLVNILNPDCIVVNSARLADTHPPDLMYFSFVTLATLGYGDITPVAPIARSLAELEALSGTLYMAVLMARLVSLHRGRPGHHIPSRNDIS